MCKDEEEKEPVITQCSQCKRELPLSFFLNHKEKIVSKCSICRGKHECEHCSEKARYNFPKEEIPRFCETHKEDGMVVVTGRLCHTNGCGKRANFNYEGKVRGVFCNDHKESGMIDIAHEHCEYSGCTVRPCYNFEGETQGRFCNGHKADGMIDVISPKCEYSGCTVRPCYNFEGETQGRFCNDHKADGMIDIKCKKCEYTGCNKQPSYNFKEEYIARFCFDHKEDKMINIKSNKCELCGKIPVFNFIGKTKGKYCDEHKKEGMVNVISKRCEFPECETHANFNLETESKPRFCEEHAKEGMINVKGCNKKCLHTECSTTSSYGYCSQPATYCAKHRLPRMFKKSKRKCLADKCSDIATNGINEPTHCDAHIEKDEICLLEAKCKQCNQVDLLTKEGLCITVCSPCELYNKRKSHQKTKEISMLAYLDNECKDIESDYKIADDRVIDKQCNAYRPDRLIDCGTHMVIIECDEFQHKNKEVCNKYRNLRHMEDCRMYAIQQACGGVPCVFLRWNPDAFRINDTVCKKYPVNKRHQILAKWLRHCVALEVTKEQPPMYIELFYDGYKEGNTSFTTITEQDIV